MVKNSRLKGLIARILRPPAIFRTSAAAGSSRSLSTSESSRNIPAVTYIAHEPIVISHRGAAEADELHLSLLHRSSTVLGKKKNDSAISDFYERKELGEGDGKTYSPATPSVESPNIAHLYYNRIREGELKNKWKKKKKKRMMKQRKSPSNRCELSISSQTDAFFSSRRFFSGSLEFYRRPSPKTRKSSKKTEQENIKVDQQSKFSSRPRRPATARVRDWMKQRKRSPSNRCELSISSETDAFFSSRRFFSDSLEFYRRPSPKTRKSSKKTGQGNIKVDQQSKFSSRLRRPATARARDWIINGFYPLVYDSFFEENDAEKDDVEGFPVLHISTNPYSDFRSSVVEMIIEKQILGARELERLLHYYLSLNSPEIHSFIF